MALRRTGSLISHITQLGSKGQGRAHDASDIAINRGNFDKYGAPTGGPSTVLTALKGLAKNRTVGFNFPDVWRDRAPAMFSGSGAPVDGAWDGEIVGDLYLDVSTGDIYRVEGPCTWELVGYAFGYNNPGGMSPAPTGSPYEVSLWEGAIQPKFALVDNAILYEWVTPDPELGETFAPAWVERFQEFEYVNVGPPGVDTTVPNDFATGPETTYGVKDFYWVVSSPFGMPVYKSSNENFTMDSPGPHWQLVGSITPAPPAPPEE